MAEELIDSYVDREGIKGDTDFILKQLNEVLAIFRRINGIKVDLSADKSFRAAAESIKKYTTEEQNFLKVEREIEESRKKRIALESQQAKILAEEKILLQQSTMELKNQVKEQNAAAGSIDKLSQQLGRLRDAYRKLSEDERQSAAGQSQLKQIQALDAQVKTLDATIGNHQRNVGNYSGSVKVLEKALIDVRNKMDAYAKSGNASAQAVEALAREEGLLVALVSNQANGFASATAEVRNNERALQQLAAAGLQATDFYAALLKETAELKDNVGDLKQTIKGLASDTSTLDGLVQGAQTLAGAYGIAQGAASLFGDENEDLQKTLVKLQAVQAIIAGLQAVQNALQKESSLMLLVNTARTSALAVATRVYTFVTGAATVSARAFNAVLLASGLGVVVVLLGFAASAMSSLGDATDDTTDALKKQREETERLNKLNEERAELAEKKQNAEKGNLDDLKRRLQLEEASGASEAKRFQTRNAILNEELDNLRARRNSIDADGKRELDLDKDIADKKNAITANQLEYQKKVSEDLKKDQKERSEKSIEYAERERAAQFALLKLSQEDRIRSQSDIAGNDDAGLTARVAARLEQYEQERVLAIADRDFQLSNGKLIESEREVIRKTALGRLKDLEEKSAADIIAIRKSVNDKDAAQMAEAEAYGQSETDKGTQRQIDSITKVTSYRQGVIEEAAITENETFLEQYKKGEINKETYEQKKLESENKARRKSLLEEVQHQEDLLKVVTLTPEAAALAQERLNELRKKLRQDDLTDEEKATEKSKEFHQKRNDKLKELANELKETAFAILTAGLENEKNKVQEQIDTLEAKKQKDIEVANQTITSTQDRAAAVAIIEARASAQREQLEKRKRQLDQEKARYERAKNIADIIQSTAIAVVSALGAKPWGPQNIALAAIVGAIGAAQIARTLATPIPKYKNHTNFHPGGLAYVGDGGVEEKVVIPTGEEFITPAKATLVDLPRGTKVLPISNEEVWQMQIAGARRQIDRTMGLAASMKKPNDAYQFQNMTAQLGTKLDKVERAIKNIPQTNVVVQSVMKRWVRGNGSINDYL